MGLSLKLRKQVNGFRLDVEWAMENELAVLFGFSGAGKSMTLQLIAGLIQPDEGWIYSGNRTLFDSRSGINLAPQDRSIGYVFQNLALFPHMTVKGNILYGAGDLKKEQRRRTDPRDDRHLPSGRVWNPATLLKSPADSSRGLPWPGH